MAGNDDLDEGQRALSDGESVAVPSRDGSDSDDGAPKLPPAVRKLADTLSSGERDGAPSTAGLNPDAPRQRRKCAPVPKTPRPPRREGKAPPPKRARAAPKDGDAQPVAPLAPPASPPAKWRGSGDDPDDAMELLSDSDDEAPAAADDGDTSDRDSEPAPAPQPQPPPTEGDAAYAAALAAAPPPEGDEAFARTLAEEDDEDEAATPEESTANDAALAAALAGESSGDEDAAPSAPARIPKCLQDRNKSGVCDPFAAPEHVDITRQPPRRTCTQPAPAVRPRKLAPLPPPPPSPPPRRGASVGSSFVVGQKVMVRHDGGPRFFRGTITAVRSDPPFTFDVAYDDGDHEEAVADSLIKRALPSFDVDFGKNGKHRGTVIEEDGDGVTIEWRPVHLKRGEKEAPEVEERSLSDLEKYLAAFRTGGRVHDVGPSAGLFVELFAGRGGAVARDARAQLENGDGRRRFLARRGGADGALRRPRAPPVRAVGRRLGGGPRRGARVASVRDVVVASCRRAPAGPRARRAQHQ